MKSIFVSAGDPSGDWHGAELIRALRRESPGLRVAAVGGPLIRREADEFLEDLASLGVAGFWEPVARIPFFWRLRARIKEHLATRRTDALICVDYYGFNRWVLQAAKDTGIPAYYYVGPQVWASRPGRIQVLKRLVRRMFVIFPFEEKVYRDAGVPVTFVGHPLVERLPEPRRVSRTGQPLRIGLLPGSRQAELRRHLPVMLEALELLRRNHPAIEAFVFAAPSLGDAEYSAAKAAGVKIIRETDYAVRATLDLALCSSGTATLENALLGVPMVVVYRMSWPTYWIARRLIRVPFISMANLLAGRELVPELIQDRADAATIARAAETLLADPRKVEALREELAAVRRGLGGPGAPARAARQLLQELGFREPVNAR